MLPRLFIHQRQSSCLFTLLPPRAFTVSALLSRLICLPLICSTLIRLTLICSALASSTLICSTLASSAVAQDMVTMGEWKTGFQGYNILAQGNQMEIASLAQWRDAPAANRAVIMIGNIDKPPINFDVVAKQGIPILVASDQASGNVLADYGVFVQSSFRPPSNKNNFFKFPDCPRIRAHRLRDGRFHSLFNNVRNVITNRPGQVFVNSATGASTEVIAYHPSENSRRQAFATVSASSQIKLACLADDSMFNNQMIALGTNGQFAQNTIMWLRENGQRNQLLFIVNNEVMKASDPDQLMILPPPPTREQVLNTLKNLPPEVLLEYGNEVARSIEDSNLINDFLYGAVDKVSERSMTRFWILFSFAAMTMFCMVTYIWQKKLLRKTASDVSLRRQKVFAGRQKIHAATDRQVAASMILNAFCLDVANRRLDDWPMFPQGLETGQSAESSLMINAMSDFHQALRSQPAKHWTPQRLVELEASVNDWRRQMAKTGHIV